MREARFAILDSNGTVLSGAMCDADSTDSIQVATEGFNGVTAIEIADDQRLLSGMHFHEGKFYEPSWVFDATENTWVAPVPYPTDGRLYRWVENDDWKGWDPLTPYPSWVYVEEENAAYPPVPYPADGQSYVWNESIVGWDLTTQD